MSKKFLLKVNTILLVLVMLFLIGAPGIFQGFTKFKKGAEQIEFKIEHLADGSYLTRLSGLSKNTVPVFNISSANHKIDFASLHELGGNVYFRGATIVDPNNQEELKVLEKRLKVNGKKKFQKVAAIGKKSLYALLSNNLTNIQHLDLSLIVADLNVFKTDCFNQLIIDSNFSETCPEINLNLPFDIEYFESDGYLEAYILPTHDPIWTELGVYSSQIEVIYGHGKTKKTAEATNERIKAKIVNLRKGKILTVGTFKILPVEDTTDIRIELDDPVFVETRQIAPSPSPSYAVVPSASSSPFSSASPSAYPTASASPKPSIYPTASASVSPSATPLSSASPSPSPTPKVPLMFVTGDPLVICHEDLDGDGVIKPGSDQRLIPLSRCASRNGSAAIAENSVMKISGNISSPHIPAISKGATAIIPSGYIPLPSVGGRPAICGNAAEHFRAWLESKGVDATFTIYACTFNINLVCERPFINKIITLGQHRFSHAVTDVHQDGKTSYVDPQNDNIVVDLDGNNDGKVSSIESGLHDQLGDDSKNNSQDISESTPEYELLKATCDGKKPLRVELKPVGNCLVASYDSREQAEKMLGAKIPRTWEEWERNHGINK